ncbi:ABC transporter substrate-binding protein [Bordetella petrii]|uniref:ABC transporter substrate-binding protein n=1 Tax=Bordetella petrii TaxID=94624 RepID=UPI001A966470|nr:ABC transporter substrate-binding protein [Bordetella petrii]MBO1112569.1 ABC transporter substrate-binding protein [Bordetella petrii]
MKKLLAGLALCQGLTLTSLATAADLTIGGLLPMSGSNAEYGQIFSSGANLAVEHINASKMLSGKLSIVYEDSQALPMQGVIGMNKLVNVAKVPFVLSAFTGVSKAIAPIGTRSKTVMVNGGGVGPDLAELGEYFWNTIPLVDFEVRAMVPYLVKQRGLKRIALVYVDDPLGQSVVKELKTELGKAGGELAGSFSVPATAQQFSGIAARVRDVKPDAVYIASYGSQQGQIVKQLRDNGVSQQIASYSAFAIPSTLSLPESRGAIFTSQKVDWDKADDITRRMLDDYKKKYGKAPSMYVLNYYNAVRAFGVLAAALEKAGKPVTGENLLAQRKATKTFDFVGATVSFAENGTIQAPIQINEIGDKGAKPIADAAR